MVICEDETELTKAANSGGVVTTIPEDECWEEGPLQTQIRRCKFFEASEQEKGIEDG